MAVDDRFAPLFVGGEKNARAAVFRVHTPGEIALAVDLKTAAAGEGHAIGRVRGNAVRCGWGHARSRGRGRRCARGRLRFLRRCVGTAGVGKRVLAIRGRDFAVAARLLRIDLTGVEPLIRAVPLVAEKADVADQQNRNAGDKDPLDHRLYGNTKLPALRRLGPGEFTAW